MFIRSSPFQTFNSFEHKTRICFRMFLGFDLLGEQMSKNGNFPSKFPQGALQRFYKGIRATSTSTEISKLKFGTFMATLWNVTTRHVGVWCVWPPECMVGWVDSAGRLEVNFLFQINLCHKMALMLNCQLTIFSGIPDQTGKQGTNKQGLYWS